MNNPVTRRVLPLLAIVLSLAILGWASMRASAAWQFFAARSYESAMYQSGKITQEGIDKATGRINLALGRLPRHPDYLVLAGRLQELQAGQPGVLGKKRRDYLEAAADYYRRSLTVRPLWPHSWARLLAVKDRLARVDDEFVLALRRCVETGPWTPAVQLQVVSSGLRHWDSLAAAERGMVRTRVSDGLKKQPREIFEVVKRFGRADLVCVDEVSHPQIEKWCAGVAAQLPG